MIVKVHIWKKTIFMLLKVLLLGTASLLLLSGCETLLGVAFLLLDPCDSYLVGRWNVSPDYPDRAAEDWCRELCRFEGASYDRVERDRYVLGDVLRCYGCK